ncbi:MAG: hypothetical protein ACE5JX_23250, partial [Acidobacteriota bacterium]
MTRRRNLGGPLECGSSTAAFWQTGRIGQPQEKRKWNFRTSKGFSRLRPHHLKQVVTRRPSSASPGSRRWEEAVAANERAWAVSQERIRSKGLGVGQGDFHSYFWLHYGYLQQGRYREARVMLETVEAASKAADP